MGRGAIQDFSSADKVSSALNPPRETMEAYLRGTLVATKFSCFALA